MFKCLDMSINVKKSLERAIILIAVASAPLMVER